jgi:ATP-dependent Clp protease ATP-binding subunit ClpA
MDASNILKPALASGRMRCIGSTTYPEYKSAFERDRALARRFQKIEIGEPTIAETIQILEGLKGYYEEHHGVRYSAEALRAAAELSAKHINDRMLPDKAVDVIDEAGASLKLLDPARRLEMIDAAQIELVVARIAKVPPKTVSVSDKDRLQNLERDLKLVIFGQDHAIERLTRAIKLSRSGLGNPDKPIGSFLFSGPTGVGKTELAKQLARELGVAFIRFDMSEYMEKHTVSRLIGAPPGYVGFDQGGLLTDAINKTPYSVLVLDEIEKAHPDLFNILLQMMDHATLTDNNGKKADFRNVILIMTTNAGGRDVSGDSIGFQKGARGSKGKGAIERTFSPEFRNRLDAWIAFEPLSFPVIEKVVDKFIAELSAQLVEKQVTVELTEAGRAWLATNGFDRLFGARPMARLIQTKVKEPLAEEILFGKLQAGGHVLIDDTSGEIALTFQQLSSPEATKVSEPAAEAIES